MLLDIFKYFKKGGFPFLILCLAILLTNRGGSITLIGIFSIALFFTYTLRKKIDLTGAGLVLYGLIYLTFSTINGVTYTYHTVFLYGVAPFFFYTFGQSVTDRWKDEDELVVFWLIIIFCYCADIFQACITKIIATGELIDLKRDFSVSGEDTSEMSATLVGLSMDVGMIGLPMFIISKGKKYRYFFFLLFLLSILVTTHLLNRTGLVVLMLCLVGIIGWRSRKTPTLFLKSAIVLLVLFLFLQYTGILSSELFQYYSERNDDISTMGHRSFRWAYALSQLFIKPIGWAENGEIYYVHNMWLDVARVSGIVPFLLLTSFTISGFIKAFRYIRRTENLLSYLLLGLNIAFFASCFVEPIYGGTHFLLYCMLWGFQSTLYLKSDKLIV